MYFLGTSYASPDESASSIAALAREEGIAEHVSEQSERLPYFETLRLLQQADLLLVPGSDDPGYTASKILPYVLTRRPLLAVFREESIVASILRELGVKGMVTFASHESVDEVAKRIEQTLLDGSGVGLLNEAALESMSAREMTKTLCAVFERAMAGPK
jgi:hypothetical protein